MADERRPVRILHLSYDLRDRRGRPVTTAVRELIDGSRSLAEAGVIDLLRVPPTRRAQLDRPAPGHLRIDAPGLPYGLFLGTSLWRVVRRIELAHRRGLLDLAGTDCLHAHKVTLEGFVALQLSRRWNIPLMVTLRQTDPFVLRWRPDFLPAFRETLERSRAIFYVTPYILEVLRRRVGPGFYERHVAGKLFFLPNIVERGAAAGGRLRGGGAGPRRLLTILRMTRRSVKRKNIRRLLEALKEAGLPGLPLEVIGGGEYLPVVRGWVRELGLGDRVRFLGDVPNPQIDRHLQEALAFVLPSTSETFGMVYAEALLNGTPILYSRGTGFDGMFEDVGAAVDPASVRSIAAGLQDIVRRNGEYRERIARLEDSGAFRIFGRPYALQTYARALQGALPPPAAREKERRT